MKRIRHLTAALCAVVLLCAFTLPAYASSEAWESAEPATERPVQTAKPTPALTPEPVAEPSTEPTSTPDATPAATAAPTVTNTSAASSTMAADANRKDTAPAVTLSADDTTEADSSTTGGVDWEGLDPAELNPLTPDGQGTVVDNADDSEGKEFFTVTTADESVFYLVIDRQKNGENVYFLNTVTVADLLALAEASGEDLTSTVTPEPEPEPTPSAEPEPEPEPEAQNGGMGMLLLALAVVAVGGGAGWYFKIYRPKQRRAAADLEDEYESEPDYENSYDGVDNDTSPWDEEDDLEEDRD